MLIKLVPTLKENVSTKRPLSPNDVTDISTKKSMYDLAILRLRP